MSNLEDKRISVIVTNYNHAQYLPQALDSLLWQTHQNLEVIVIDDKSTDQSVEVLKQWDTDHKGFISKIILLPENKGKWNALNKGISEATSTLITLQDADDVSTKQRLSRQLRCLLETNTYHNLTGFFHCFDQASVDKNREFMVADENNLPYLGSGEVTRLVMAGRKTPGINHYFTGSFETHGATCLFYRQLWENGMRFMPGNMGLRCQFAEDSDFNTKMTLLLQRTSVLMEPLYCYRRNTSTNNAYREGY